MDLQDSTILLTGATGFVGSHLLKRLINEECKVHISIRNDNSIWRIKRLMDKCYFHKLDLTHTKKVRLLLNDIKPDIVFHLAAYGVDYRQDDIKKAIDINIKSSICLYQSFLENGGLRFVYTGTSLEYGSLDRPIAEQDPYNPLGLYGITKNAAANLLSTISNRHDADGLIILRPFGAFGESEGAYKLFPLLINSLSKGRFLKLTECEQIRDYIYINDLIDAFVMCADARLENSVECINIGSGQGISLKDIALLIAEELGSDKDLLCFGAIPYRPDEIMSSIADIRKARRILGWTPKTSLKDGIKNMIDHEDSDA